MKSNRADTVTIRTKINFDVVDAVNAIELLLTLDASTATTGLSARSQVLAAYMDMYRYFKIDKLVCHVVSSFSAATEASCYINYLSPGTASPTNAGSFETPHQVLTSSYAPRPLKIPVSVFRNVGAWCVTQGDATDEVFLSFGELYISVPSGNAMPVGQFVQVDLTVTFRQLLDPASISLNFGKHAESTPPLPPRRPIRTFPPNLEVFKS